jgi:hypothetical protein
VEFPNFCHIDPEASKMKMICSFDVGWAGLFPPRSPNITNNRIGKIFIMNNLKSGFGKLEFRMAHVLNTIQYSGYKYDEFPSTLTTRIKCI